MNIQIRSEFGPIWRERSYRLPLIQPTYNLLTYGQTGSDTFTTLTQAHPTLRLGRRSIRKWLGMLALFSASLLATQAESDRPQHSGILRGGQNESRLSSVEEHPDAAPTVIRWAPNIRIMAASGQRYYSYYNDAGGYYTQALAHQLNQDSITSLAKAHQILEEGGYASSGGRTQFSPSTPRQIGGWEKSTENPHRFVLLLGQHVPGDDGFNTGIDSDLNRMSKILAKQYGVTESRILRYDNAGEDQVRNGILWLAKQAKKYPDAEVLIYYTGHGSASEAAPNDHEGDTKGMMVGSHFKEEALQALMNENLGKQSLGHSIPVYMILDMCHAGSMIAKRAVIAGELGPIETTIA